MTLKTLFKGCHPGVKVRMLAFREEVPQGSTPEEECQNSDGDDDTCCHCLQKTGSLYTTVLLDTTVAYLGIIKLCFGKHLQ